MFTVNNPFKLDFRSIALARIFLGFSLLLNFMICADNLTVFYTNAGVMPAEALPIKFQGIRHFSLNVLIGDYWFQLLLIILAFVSSLLMIFGAYTRYSIFFSWLLFLSFYNRNPLVVDGGDDALKLFLFLLCFLPTANFFSIDKAKQSIKNEINIAACIAFIIQLGSIYFFSALLKSSPQWRVDGSALHRALALGVFTSKLGDQLLNFPNFLKYMTWTTWWAEFIVPIFLLIPFFSVFFRTIAALTFISFHLGLIVFMDLGLFPYTMISAWLALLPSFLWDTKVGIYLQTQLEKFFNQISNKIITKQSLEAFFPSNQFTILFCMFFTVYITLWNIRGTDFDKYSPYFSSKLDFIGNSIRIDQYWALFAPRPTQEGGWEVILGELKNKTSINPKTGQQPNFNRPPTTASHYKDFRWKKYVLNTWLKTNSQFRKYYANYLCKLWNSKHSGQYALEEVKIIFMLEKTLDPNMPKPRTEPQPHVTWEQKCIN